MSVHFFTPLTKRLVMKVKMVECIFYVQSLIHLPLQIAAIAKLGTQQNWEISQDAHWSAICIWLSTFRMYTIL
jgi:hypothetical protein